MKKIVDLKVYCNLKTHVHSYCSAYKTFCLATFPLTFHDGDCDGDGDEIPVHVLCILENEKPQWLILGIFFRKWTLSVHVQPEQVFRPIGVLNRFTELRHSKVKYKIIFYPASSPLSPSSLLKLPNYLRPGSNAVLHISRTHEPNPMLIIYPWIVAVNVFAYSSNFSNSASGYPELYSGRKINFTLKNHCPTRPLFNFFGEAVRFDWIKIDVWLKLVLLNHWSRLTLSLGSAHVKYGVWPGPKTVLQRTAKKYTKI